MFIIEVRIQIKKSDLSMEVTYILDSLDLGDICSGYWCMSNNNLSKVFSPFFIEENWHLLEEGMVSLGQ